MDPSAQLLAEIVGGRLSRETIDRFVEDRRGYEILVIGRPLDVNGRPVVPLDWPVNPVGRLA